MPTSWSTNGRLVSWTPLGVQPKQVFPHPLPSALDLLPHLSLPLEPHHPAQGHIDYIMSLCMFNDGSDSKPLFRLFLLPSLLGGSSQRTTAGGGEGGLGLRLLLLTTQCRIELQCRHMCQYLTCRLLISLFPPNPRLQHVSTPEEPLTSSTPKGYS